MGVRLGLCCWLLFEEAKNSSVGLRCELEKERKFEGDTKNTFLGQCPGRSGPEWARAALCKLPPTFTLAEAKNDLGGKEGRSLDKRTLVSASECS